MQLVDYNHICWGCEKRWHQTPEKKLRTNEIEVILCKPCDDKRREELKAVKPPRSQKIVTTVMRAGRPKIIIQHRPSLQPPESLL